jgi:methylase of polypeptide subunit release factors
LQNLSTSQSVSSSVFEFTHEHGHRYHRKPDALLPNDEAEQDRLGLQHYIFRILLDEGLTHTVLPHDRSLEIVDIGCGTGIWAIEMRDDFPNASIRGIE